MNFLELISGEINVNEVIRLVKSPDCGAVSMFLGTTRNEFQTKKVKSLFYEAYEGMTKKKLSAICSDIRDKWPMIVNIAIYHRLGKVEVMEDSVLIVISSPHRSDSLEAVRFAIDELKSKAPIWKKEEYEQADASSEWKINTECPWKKVADS